MTIVVAHVDTIAQSDERSLTNENADLARRFLGPSSGGRPCGDIGLAATHVCVPYQIQLNDNQNL